MKPSQKLIDQTIALAGIAQSIRAVQNIAWKGETNQTDLKAILGSLLKIESKSAIDIYGGSFELSTGLRLVKQQLDTQNSNKDPEFVGMAIHLFAIQKQANKISILMERLTQSIQSLSKVYQSQAYYQDEEILSAFVSECSTVYKDTISTLPNRIQVKGEPRYLEKPYNQDLVRAALLCAIRSVFLWRQSGGSRWNFLFKKKEIVNTASYLISQPMRE